RRKRSRRDRPRQAGVVTTIINRSGDAKGTFRAGSVLSHLCKPVKEFAVNLETGPPGPTEGRYLDAGHVPLVAVGAATIDRIHPGDGIVGDIAGDRDDLSSDRRGGQGEVIASQGTSQVGGGQ